MTLPQTTNTRHQAGQREEDPELNSTINGPYLQLNPDQDLSTRNLPTMENAHTANVQVDDQIPIITY